MCNDCAPRFEIGDIVECVPFQDKFHHMAHFQGNVGVISESEGGVVRWGSGVNTLYLISWATLLTPPTAMLATHLKKVGHVA
jgi:hypothetical protein